MIRDILIGTVAGAAGTVALNVVTYADMAFRGRPSSDTPAKVAETVAAGVGADLADEQLTMQSADRAREIAQNRASGLGALMGFGNGLGIGTAYGVIRLVVRHFPVPIAGFLLGAAAMAASDVPSVKLGLSDPREWGASGWLADIVPHLAYGLITAAVYEALSGSRR